MAERRARATWNEDDLRADIVRVWGEYGAHADVHDWMVRRIGELEAENERLRTFLGECGDERSRMRRELARWRTGLQRVPDTSPGGDA